MANDDTHKEPHERPASTRSAPSHGDDDAKKPRSKRPSPPSSSAATSQGSSESTTARRKKSSGSGISTSQAARAALQQLADLTMRDTEGIIGIERNDDGWDVNVEVVETRRIPNTSDVLAEYLVTIDSTGELVSYSRGARYTRGSARQE